MTYFIAVSGYFVYTLFCMTVKSTPWEVCPRLHVTIVDLTFIILDFFFHISGLCPSFVCLTPLGNVECISAGSTEVYVIYCHYYHGSMTDRQVSQMTKRFPDTRGISLNKSFRSRLCSGRRFKIESENQGFSLFFLFFLFFSSLFHFIGSFLFLLLLLLLLTLDIAINLCQLT